MAFVWPCYDRLWQNIDLIILFRSFLAIIDPNSFGLVFFRRAMSFGYERNDLMNTVGLDGEDYLDLTGLKNQANDLIKLFIGKILF